MSQPLDMPGWVRPANRLAMRAILHHPRLVFWEIDADAAAIIKWYVDEGQPFTVVVR